MLATTTKKLVTSGFMVYQLVQEIDYSVINKYEEPLWGAIPWGDFLFIKNIIFLPKCTRPYTKTWSYKYVR